MNASFFFSVTVLINFIDYSLTDKFKIEDEKIANSTDCANDVIKLCKDVKEKNDINILICLQANKDVMVKISLRCQNFLWTYKNELTTSNYFDKITMNACGKDLKIILQCQGTDLGHKIPCLLDNKEKISADDCLQYLDLINLLVFSDYHLIFEFIDKCKADIKQHHCGRITHPGLEGASDQKGDNNNVTNVAFADYISSQTDTLECLMDSISEIEMDCQTQIVQLSELQSNDYHLNRGLYLACRNDRKELCEHVLSGKGRIYSCLMKAKFSDKMSPKCRAQLTRKQRVESVDVKANYPIFHSCKNDILKFKCVKDTATITHEMVKMSVILVCLNDAKRSGESLKPKCEKEISDRKSEMFEDFKISPEALAACKEDVKSHCEMYDDKPGAVVHCLMQLAEPDLQHKKGNLTPKCLDTIMTFLAETSPADSIMTSDKVIREACENSFMALCPIVHTEKEAFYCLSRNIDSPKMDPNCRDKISSFLYFISLDIEIDPKLNKACHNDAVRLCNGPSTIAATQKRTLEEKQLEYHCMFQNFKNDRVKLELAQARGQSISRVNMSLSTDCSNQIFNLLKAQSSNIKLDVSVFFPCLEDLGRFCGRPQLKGKEHACLQTNVKKLETKCRKAVINFSKLKDLDFRLNNLIRESCRPMVQKFCSNIQPENALVCLEENKFHPQMSAKCHASIEHLQIIRLENFHIDHRFASFCGPEISLYCEKESTAEEGQSVSKAAIVSCLSKKIIDKILNGLENPLSDECRKEFSFELLIRSETVTLDPTLMYDCSSDIKEFCRTVQGNLINDCLRENQDKLKDKCHKLLFRRERLEALDANFDGELKWKCSQMILENCRDVPGQRIFSCLHRSMKQDDFDRDCRVLMLSRLERRMNDIRLNPELIADCSRDIRKYCHIKNPGRDSPDSGLEYNGLVFSCLKAQYANDTESLEPDCLMRVQALLIEAHVNSRLDPILRNQCSKDIKNLCDKEMRVNRINIADGVTNCLMHNYLLNKLLQKSCMIEVQRLLKEARADVHLDRDLFEACETELATVCRSESFGNARKMKCLLTVVNDKNAIKHLGSACVVLIKEREEMWVKVGTSETRSLVQLLQSVTESSKSAYLMSMLGLLIVTLILLGICCGRVTKRVSVDLKNR